MLLFFLLLDEGRRVVLVDMQEPMIIVEVYRREIELWFFLMNRERWQALRCPTIYTVKHWCPPWVQILLSDTRDWSRCYLILLIHQDRISDLVGVVLLDKVWKWCQPFAWCWNVHPFQKLLILDANMLRSGNEKDVPLKDSGIMDSAPAHHTLNLRRRCWYTKHVVELIIIMSTHKGIWNVTQYIES